MGGGLGLLLAVASLLSGCSDLFPSSYEYATVEVQANRWNGDPVPGVNLVLYTGERHMGYGVTDEEGRHVFHFVPQGEFGVGAVASDGFELMPANRPFITEIWIERGDAESVAFTLLKEGTGSIQVLARDESGEPVGGVTVSLYTHRGPLLEGETDADGSYTFEEVGHGSYGVAMEPLFGYRIPDRFFDGIVLEGGSRELIPLRLERCEGRIRVQVRDASDRPVDGVTTVLYTFRGTVDQGETDAAGVHEFRNVKCGIEYGVRLELVAVEMLGDAPPYVDGIDPNRESEEVVTFRVRPCRGQLTAVVVDRAGVPVPDAGVTLYTFRETVAEGRTDQQGRFVFAEVPCAEYGVRVAPPAGFSVEPGRGTAYVDGIDIEGGTEESVRLVVDRQR
jgi:hypothetical protein